jgi:predicted DNA-binding protein
MVVGGYHKENNNTDRRIAVKKKTKFDLALPTEVFNRLHEIKETEGPSITFQINKAVEQYLEQYDKKSIDK